MEVGVDGGGGLTTEDSVVEVVVEEIKVDKGGKTSPFFRGRERTGFGAVPTISPCPGKVVLDSFEAATDAAAWNLAALALFRAFLPRASL